MINNREELFQAIKSLAEDASRIDQKATSGILHALAGTMLVESELLLLDIIAPFCRAQLERIQFMKPGIN